MLRKLIGILNVSVILLYIAKLENMKKIILLSCFFVSFLISSCGHSNKSSEIISEAEKIEIIKLEMETKVLETKQEEIEVATKELEVLLEEL